MPLNPNCFNSTVMFYIEPSVLLIYKYYITTPLSCDGFKNYHIKSINYCKQMKYYTFFIIAKEK